MSEENVEFVRGLYETAEGMDRKQLLEALPQLIEQTCDPEIEWIEDPGRADSQTHRGHAGVLRSWQRWLEGFDEYAFVLERVVDCGDAVLVAAREEGRGAASGASVSASIYQGDHDARRQGVPLPGVLRRAIRPRSRRAVGIAGGRPQIPLIT